MRLIDFYPMKGCYAPGSPVDLQVEMSLSQPRRVQATLEIFHFSQSAGRLSTVWDLPAGEHSLPLRWTPPSGAQQGYGAHLNLTCLPEGPSAAAQTAFDVLANWTRFPRYGFLCDFFPNRSNIAETLGSLARHHINGLQFYDWQYRHDQLTAPSEEFIDPLGRALSLVTIRDLIQSAHAHGMAAMPYLAVYGASIQFWRQHPDWGLYDADGKPHTFEDFLGIMNPAAGGPWVQHLLDQCAQTLQALPWDGLHVDQYGEPKQVWNAAGVPVDLALAFHQFIHSLKTAHPGAAVTFNAVGNWPIEALASAPEDFVYIEIWPPTPRFRDLKDITLNARRLSENRPVIIALYLPASQPANLLLADALIISAGGARIELGEEQRLLADPYFPKHQPLDTPTLAALRRYHDFQVRYAEWLGPSAAHLELEDISAPAGVEITCRESESGLAVCLVNLGSAPDPFWTEAQPFPPVQTAIEVSLPVRRPVARVLAASPDGPDLSARLVAFQHKDGRLRVSLPELRVWTTIFIEFEETN